MLVEMEVDWLVLLVEWDVEVELVETDVLELVEDVETEVEVELDVEVVAPPTAVSDKTNTRPPETPLRVNAMLAVVEPAPETAFSSVALQIPLMLAGARRFE